VSQLLQDNHAWKKKEGVERVEGHTIGNSSIIDGSWHLFRRLAERNIHTNINKTFNLLLQGFVFSTGPIFVDRYHFRMTPAANQM
jgi:hypothetical protein